MSKRKYFGTDIDRVYGSTDARCPDFRVYVWNPHRATIGDVVLGRETSPRYDISRWVLTVNYRENIVYENTEDPLATSATLELVYDPDAEPIEVSEKTLLDDTPIRIYQGDKRAKTWVCIFTGVIRGKPSINKEGRGSAGQRTMTVQAVDRAEAYLNTMVTSRSYAKGDDIGKAFVETAIEYCGLDREEINVGSLGYPIGHTQTQLVQIEVLNGLAQMIFPVGKKPKFDAEGFLCAADADFDKPPTRVHATTKELVISMVPQALMQAVNNSVRLLGMDDDLTQVVERYQRLAHGSITSGFFEDEVRVKVNFSENAGSEEGGRRALKGIEFKKDLSSLGERIFGEGARWNETVEDDGESVYGGEIVFETGWEPELRMILVITWAGINIAQILLGLLTDMTGEVTATSGGTVCLGSPGVAEASHGSGTGVTVLGQSFQHAGEIASTATMLIIILTLMELGRCDWELYGKPFQYVQQQLCSTAQLSNLLTYQIKEGTPIRNDWIYDIEHLQLRARDMLQRELVKGWSYEIEMLDDPLLEVDDVLQVGSEKYYVSGIEKRISRDSDARMKITAWRFT
jgi:hypothetical protein